MRALFGELNDSLIEADIIERVYASHGSVLGTYHPLPKAPGYRSAVFKPLNLCGDLRWLKDLTAYEAKVPIAARRYTDWEGEAAEDLTRFENTCAGLDLILPQAFLAFIGNERLNDLCSPGRPYWFHFLDEPFPLVRVVSLRMVPLPNGEEGSIDGYVCKFLHNERSVTCGWLLHRTEL
jgi:hypothetical protein